MRVDGGRVRQAKQGEGGGQPVRQAKQGREGEAEKRTYVSKATMMMSATSFARCSSTGVPRSSYAASSPPMTRIVISNRFTLPWLGEAVPQAGTEAVTQAGTKYPGGRARTDWKYLQHVRHALETTRSQKRVELATPRQTTYPSVVHVEVGYKPRLRLRHLLREAR